MKYESTILKRLIDTYGVVGNPRYISEIIKEFIVRGKESFPNLFTYQADWLAHIDEFGLNPTYTVSYTGQSFYAPNTLERPVKSAILTGQTLVNIADVSTMATYNGATILDGTIILDRSKHNSLVQITFANKLIQSGKKYIAILNEIKGNPQGVILKVQHESSTEEINFVNNRAIFIADNHYSVNRWVFVESTYLGSDAGTTSFKWSIIEYQQGMENWDIPYFEGMQSVKMPVLTTSNEDGTKTNILSTSEDVELRGIGEVRDTLDCLTGEVAQNIGEITLDGSENWTLQAQNNWQRYMLTIEDMINIYDFKNPNRTHCDKLVYDVFDAKNSGSYLRVYNQIAIYNNEIVKDVGQFKKWLSQNPITLQYQLATESIKTVDLTILDQNGQNVKQLMSSNGGTHFTTSSQDGTLLPTLTVEVVTDLEETLMVCSSEGNTM